MKAVLAPTAAIHSRTPLGVELRSVVGTNMPGYAAQDKEVRQDVDDIGRLQLPVDPYRQ